MLEQQIAKHTLNSVLEKLKYQIHCVILTKYLFLPCAHPLDKVSKNQ